ncbi:MAG: DUF5723 family protein [Bacteroidota bacterium]
MKITLILFALLLSSSSLFAQGRHYNSRSLGMGGGGTAYVNGYDANFINPANLMLKNHRNNTQIGILPFGLQSGGTLANLSVYNEYFTDGLSLSFLDQSGQPGLGQQALNDWFGSSSSNTRELSTTISTIGLGVSHRGKKQAFSLAVRSRFDIQTTLNKGLAELAVYGLDSRHFSDGVPVNFEFTGAGFTEVSVGYARQVLALPNLLFARNIKVFAGVAPKYIVGLQAGTAQLTSDLTVATGGSEIDHQFSYTGTFYGDLADEFRSYADARNAAILADQDTPDFEVFDNYDGGDVGTVGSGFGVDLGATATMDISGVPLLPGFLGKKKTLILSMSVTDLGAVTFDDRPTNIAADGVFEFRGATGSETIEDYFDNLADSLENDVYGGFTAENGEELEYELPGMYNFGAALTTGKFTTSVDYGFGFNGNGVNSRRSVLNLGLEYRFFNFLPIRTGMRVGGFSSTAYSFGTGLDLRFLEFSFSVANVGNSENNGSAGAVAFSGLVFRF